MANKQLWLDTIRSQSHDTMIELQLVKYFPKMCGFVSDWVSMMASQGRMVWELHVFMASCRL